ncbi:hypothetical protein JCM3770_005014 [Rhodotorula araucariae]
MAPQTAALAPAVIPTLCLVSLVAAASLAPQPVPHLDALAALALECTHEHDQAPPPSLHRWLDRARGPNPSDPLAADITGIHQTVLAVRARGMDNALHWLANQFRTLVAPSDDDELTVTLHAAPPPPLLRASPLGVYVRRAAITLARLEFAETLEWWGVFERWCDGEMPEARGKRRREVSSFARARLQQDYHAAREHVRTFVSAGQREPTAQQALLHLALVEYEDGGLEAAQLALDEATQIARTVGDSACLAACASLRLRLEAAVSGAEGSGRKIGRAARDSPHDLLWELGERCAEGAPLDTLFPLLVLSRAAAQHLAFPPARPPKPDPAHAPGPPAATSSAPAAAPDPAFDAAWHAAAAGLWDEIGVDALARVHMQLAGAIDDAQRPAWDVRLAVLAREVNSAAADLAYARLRKLLVREKRPAAATRALLCAVDTRDKRAGMGMREVRTWRALLRRVEAGRNERAEGEHDDVDEGAPPFLRLMAAATAMHAARDTQRERARVEALLALLEARQRAGGAPERGLRELEEAWSAVLALEEDDGPLGVRASEVRALGMVAARSDDAALPELVDELSTLAERYLSLADRAGAQRALFASAKLADHLATVGGATARGAWTDRRDALASAWLAVERRQRDVGEGEGEGERWARVRRVEALVERAVERAIS